MQYKWISVSVTEELCLRPASGPGAQRTDVEVKNYLLRVILEILLQCSVFIIALIIVSVASINVVIC